MCEVGLFLFSEVMNGGSEAKVQVSCLNWIKAETSTFGTSPLDPIASFIAENIFQEMIKSLHLPRAWLNSLLEAERL